MPTRVSLDEIRAAAVRLDGVATRTPLLGFPPSGRSASKLLIKAESLQPVGSFKLRGAYAAISALDPGARERGVVAHSSGNHAHAVAYAAALLGAPATVVVPRNAPEVKIAPVRRLGATIVFCDASLAARTMVTDELAREHGYTFIAPFDDPVVIAGQGTIGLEIAEDCPQVEAVMVPVSGGGLISGVAAAIRALCPGAAVIGVEPELAADAGESYRARRRVAWPPGDTQRTIADALRVEQIGELPLRHLLDLVDDMVTVSEEEIRAAVRALALRARLVAEPGGAVAVAAALRRAEQRPAAGTTVAVLSGGNIDPSLLASILAETAEPALGQGGGAAARPGA